MNELLAAKIQLYKLLLSSTSNKDPEDIADSDIELMYVLAKDPEVQSVFS
jgi:hypothetical protein